MWFEARLEGQFRYRSSNRKIFCPPSSQHHQHPPRSIFRVCRCCRHPNILGNLDLVWRALPLDPGPWAWAMELGWGWSWRWGRARGWEGLGMGLGFELPILHTDPLQPHPHPHRKRVYFLDNDGGEWEFVQYLSDEPGQRNDYAL